MRNLSRAKAVLAARRAAKHGKEEARQDKYC
jgi:hypothetical protein